MENIAQIANIFQIVVFFIFGSLIGSFSNVVIFRMVTGVSIVFPPSSCPKCGHRLDFFDLFPIFSWLFLKGKCRYCKAPISFQYPLVEAAIALITGLAFIKYRLTFKFITISSALIILFIASVIFFRNEVKSPNPFLWAIAYFTGLFWLCGISDSVTANQFTGIIIFSCLVGCASSHERDSHAAIGFTALSLAGMYALSSYGYVCIHYCFAAIIAGMLSKKAKTAMAGRIAFLILQTATIFTIILN